MLSPVVHTVSQVAVYLKDKLESDSLLSRLTVQGEIANLRTVASGHSYFTLREDGSSIRCVMFRGRSGQEYLEDGQEILAGGNFTFYPPYGEANMQVAAVMPVGAGPWPWNWPASATTGGRGSLRPYPQATHSGLSQGDRRGHVAQRRGLAGYPERRDASLPAHGVAPVAYVRAG